MATFQEQMAILRRRAGLPEPQPFPSPAAGTEALSQGLGQVSAPPGQEPLLGKLKQAAADDFVPEDEPVGDVTQAAPSEPAASGVAQAYEPGDVSEVDPIIFQNPEELAKNPLFNPIKYAADKIGRGEVLTIEEQDFLAKVLQIQEYNGYGPEHWAYMLEEGVKQSPEMLATAAKGFLTAGWDYLQASPAGRHIFDKTEEEQIRAVANLAHSMNLAVTEMQGPLFATGLGAIAEGAVAVKEGENVENVARRAGAEFIRNMVTLGGGLLWAEKKLGELATVPGTDFQLGLPSPTRMTGKAVEALDWMAGIAGLPKVYEMLGKEMVDKGSTIRGQALRFANEVVDSQKDPRLRLMLRADRYRQLESARSGGDNIIASALGFSEELLADPESGVAPVDPERIDAQSFVVDPITFLTAGAGAIGPKVAAKAQRAAVRSAASAVSKAPPVVESILGAAARKTADKLAEVGPAARRAAATKAVNTGKALQEFGHFFQGKVAGLAVATGLTAALFSGDLRYGFFGLGALVGAKQMQALGRAIEKSGIKFAAGEGFVEWMRKQAVTGSKGALAGAAGAIPIAGLMEDPEMGASVIASGFVAGPIGAHTAQATAATRAGILNKFHEGWAGAEQVANVPPVHYRAEGESAAQISKFNKLHEAQVKAMAASGPVGRRNAGLLNLMRNKFQMARDPATGREVPVRIFTIPRKDFAETFGADAHGIMQMWQNDGATVVLSEDTTGLGHELGHLLDAFGGTETHTRMVQKVKEVYGDGKIETVRQWYEDMLNMNREPGTPRLERSTEHAINELIAEHYSLILRGTDVNNALGTEIQQVIERIGEAFQANSSIFDVRVGMEATATAGLGLPIEPSFAVVREARRALDATDQAGTFSPLQGPPLPPPEAAPTAPAAPPAPAAPAAPPAPTPRRRRRATPEADPQLELGLEQPTPPAPEGTAVSPEPATAAPEAGPLAGVTPEPTTPFGAQPRGRRTAARAPSPTPADTDERLRPGFAPEPARRPGDVRDLNDIQRVLDQAERNPNVPESQKETLREMARAAQQVPAGPGGNVVSIAYQSVKPTVAKTEAGRRYQRRADQAQAYYREALEGPEVKDETREVLGKNVIPYRFDVTKSGRVQIVGMSPDKALANFDLLLNDLLKDATLADLVPEWIPADWAYTQDAQGNFHLTGEGLNAFARDLAIYSNNHANGYTGQGQKIKVPEGYQRFIPETTPGIAPVPLAANTATALNALMGLAPPLTTRKVANMGVNPVTGQKVTSPANVEAQILATENNMQPVPAKFVKDPTARFPGGEAIMEVNPFREAMGERGYNPRQNLVEVVERLNLEDVAAVEAVRPTTLAPISVPLAQGGFLPRKKALQRLSDVAKMPVADFVAEMQTAPHGMTGQSYILGISLADASELALTAARQYQERSNQRVAEMLDADPGNPDLMGEAMRGQFYREMAETTEQSGSMAPYSAEHGLIDNGLLMRHHQAGGVFRAMQEGTEFGGSFNADGTLFDHRHLKERNERTNQYEAEKTDMATITSVDIPLTELNQARVREALAPFVDALGYNRVKPGVFKLDRVGPDGQALVSIDVNAVVNQRHRANTAAFLKKNNQQAGWDNNLGEAFDTGGTGESVVSNPADVLRIAQDLVAGRMPEFMARDTGAKTEAGRRLAERGLAIVAEESPNQIDVFVADAQGIRIGDITATNRPETGWAIDMVIVDRSFQRQGLGETLYRELGARLQEKGAETISGTVVSPEALALREKVYGISEIRRGPDPVSVSQLKADLKSIGMGAKVTSLIGGEYMARPNARREHIVTAAVRSRETGKIWTGQMHYLAMQKAFQELGAGPQTYMRHFLDQMNDQGFMTSEGRFVGREEAGRIADQAMQRAEDRAGDSLVSEDVDPQFMARKKKPAKKMDVGEAEQYASWVLPNGEVAIVTEGFHENHVAAHAADYNKRFGTKFDSTPDVVKGREAALKAGFIRIRYNPQGGEFVAEIPVQVWPKRRKLIEELVVDNSDFIDNIRLSTVDTKTMRQIDHVAARTLGDMEANLGVVSDLRTTPAPKGAQFMARRTAGPELPGMVFEGGPTGSPQALQQSVEAEIRLSNKRNRDALPLEVRKNLDGTYRIKDGKPVYGQIPWDFTGSHEANKVRNRLKKSRKPQELETLVREKTADVLADKAVDYVRNVAERDPSIMRGKPWYSVFAKLNRAIFGPDVEIFGKLLATTSPQTAVRENFVYTLDAYNNYKAGRYDAQLQQTLDALEAFRNGDPELTQQFYQDVKDVKGISEADLWQRFARWYVTENGLEIKRADGKAYGQNSVGATQALLGTWIAETAGKKTSQFYRNLTGADWGPTIDVWAARFALRMLNEGGGRKWRRQEKNETGVGDVDYDIAADGFRKAAARLGMEPAELQAVLWFAEKKFWDSRRWTSAGGAKLASFIEFAESLRRTPEGNLVIQPVEAPAGLDITPEQAEAFTVPEALPFEQAPIERFGPGGQVVEQALEQAMRGRQQEFAL